MKGRSFYITVCSLWLASVALLSACSTTNSATDTSDFAKAIRKGTRNKRSMLMYSGLDTFKVTHIILENRRRDMTVQLDRIDSVQRRALINNDFKKKTTILIMRDSTSYLLNEPHTIAISKIGRIEVKD